METITTIDAPRECVRAWISTTRSMGPLKSLPDESSHWPDIDAHGIGALDEYAGNDNDRHARSIRPGGTPAISRQAVLPGAIATEFWGVGGMPVTHLPPEIVMTSENLVDAALARVDQSELVTIPALADKGEWDRYEAARRDMSTRLSRTEPAARYGIKALARAS